MSSVDETYLRCTWFTGEDVGEVKGGRVLRFTV